MCTEWKYSLVTFICEGHWFDNPGNMHIGGLLLSLSFVHIYTYMYVKCISHGKLFFKIFSVIFAVFTQGTVLSFRSRTVLSRVHIAMLHDQ